MLIVKNNTITVLYFCDVKIMEINQVDFVKFLYFCVWKRVILKIREIFRLMAIKLDFLTMLFLMFFFTLFLSRLNR